ncbi:MAG: hypothetical protein RL495_878 [Verrucomicrobiota bacterium]|jgi:hypothetical protein
MPFRLLRPRSERPSTVAPYSRLLCVKLKSPGDEVVSILSANGRPIFAAMEPVKPAQLTPAKG